MKLSTINTDKIKSWLPSECLVVEEKLPSGEIGYKISLTLSESKLILKHELSNSVVPSFIVHFWAEIMARHIEYLAAKILNQASDNRKGDGKGMKL